MAESGKVEKAACSRCLCDGGGLGLEMEKESQKNKR